MQIDELIDLEVLLQDRIKVSLILNRRQTGQIFGLLVEVVAAEGRAVTSLLFLARVWSHGVRCWVADLQWIDHVVR